MFVMLDVSAVAKDRDEFARDLLERGGGGVQPFLARVSDHQPKATSELV